MAKSAPNSLPAFGFLTVVEDEEHGFFGGYLVLSELGRPLEFHCSTPILPSPVQKILYGSTLRSYVLGELIGQTLVKKSQVPVQVVLTDLAEMLSLALVWPGVLAWTTAAAETPAPVADEAASPVLDLDGFRLAGSTTCRWTPESLQELIAPLVSYVDLTEPFLRIREAIQEAQRVTQHPAGGTDDVAAVA